MKKITLLGLVILLCAMNQGVSQESLYVLNPERTWYWKKARIEKATLSIKPAGTYFEMGLYLDISSKGSNFSGDIQLESFMNFSLPEGSHVLDSWLWVYDDIIQGKILDKWTASNIYEEIVDRRRDPSILKKLGADQYELRVYPMKPQEIRRVKITYLVPGRWSNGEASVPLPTNILKASNHTPGLHLLVWEKDGFVDPEIPELEDKTFIAFHDNEFGDYKRLDISGSEVENDLSFQMKAPINDGIYLTAHQTMSGRGVYQLGVDFDQFLDVQDNMKAAIMVDYEANNTSMSRSVLFGKIKSYMLDNYTERDSFNLFYSRYEIERASENWLPVKSETLDLAFKELEEGNITLYSNLPGLLMNTYGYITEKGGGSLLLFSNADNFDDHTMANALISDIRQMDFAPINITDFQNLNLSNQRIGQRYYYGQDYLFTNLSRVTGGNYNRLENEPSYDILINQSFGALSGSIKAFDLYTMPSNGFCYARYNRNDQEVFQMGDYFIQTGKFMGEFPFHIVVSGLFNSAPFNHILEIDEAQIYTGDSMIQKAWHGEHIRYMERKNPSNENINEILFESIENRVLSTYTAFLCLEPSDTISICVSCQDETILTGFEDFSMAVQDSISLFPNPCRNDVNIKIDTGTDWKSGNITIEIFSVLGEKVYFRDESFIPGQQLEMNWDLTGPYGSKVAKGTYFVMVKGETSTLKKTLIVR